MEFLNGLGTRNSAVPQLSNITDTPAAIDETLEDCDEITDETLLEAIVGTGDPRCQNTSSSGRYPANTSIARNNRHKHR